MDSYIQSDYLDGGFSDRAVVLSTLEGVLVQHRAAFDGLICTGVSGMLFAPSLADRLCCPLAVVRKPGESTHSYTKVEGYRVPRVIMVDDFVSSGDTVRRVYDALHGIPMRLVGILLWRHRGLLCLSEDVIALAEPGAAGRACWRGDLPW